MKIKKYKRFVLTAALVLSFGLILTTGKQANADTLVDPVVINFPEDAHVAIGMDLNDLLPLITIDQTSSRGIYRVAEIPANEKTDADKQYEGFIVGKQKVGSSAGYDSVNLNSNPVIEEGFEYSVQFYYRPITGFSLSSEYDPSHALVNGEPVNALALAGGGSRYRQAVITLSPADWGSISFDLTSGEATLKNRASGVVLQRTFLKLERTQSDLIACTDDGANKLNVDLDKDGTDDIQINIGARNSTTQLITKLNGASVKGGRFEFKIPKTDMPYNGEGICCNKSVYSAVTLNFGGTGTDNTDPTPAPTANPDPTTAPGQNNTGTDPGTLTPGTVLPVKTGNDSVEIEKIELPKAVIKSCKAKAGRKIVLKFKSIDAADGYEIAYCTDKRFKKAVKTKKSEKTSFTLKGFKKKKVYYIRVRAYVDDEGKMITGRWSAAKRIKIKK